MRTKSRGTLQRLLPTQTKARILALAFMFVAPLLTGAIAIALGQDANWDHRNYHWYNGFATWHGLLRFDILPSQLPFFYAPWLDVLYYLLGSAVPPKATAFSLGFIQGLNAVLLFLIAHTTLNIQHQRQKVLVCAALAGLGLWGGGGFALIGTNFYDNVISLGILSSLLLVLRLFPALLESTEAKAFGLVLLCGIPAGLMAGFKLPLALFGIGLCAAFLGSAGPWRRRMLLAFGFGTGFMCGFAVSYGPWGWFLFSHYGSPLFPYFNDIFQSSYAPPTSTRDMKFLPHSWQDKLFFPFVFSTDPTRVGEIHWQDFRILVLYILLPFAVVFRLLYGRNKKAVDAWAPFYAARYLLWSAVIAYIVWMSVFAIYRYLIPLEMLAPLLIVLAIGMMPAKQGARTLWAVVILCGIALTVQPGNWGRADRWLDSPAPVHVPDLGRTDNLMILMAGWQPYAHVRPAFPVHVPFIRIQSNLIVPEQGFGLNDEIRRRINAHKNKKGRFMLLIPAWDFENAARGLKHFDLTLQPHRCQDVIDHLYPSQLKLCPVHILR